jgi:hypothetical protein
MLRSDTDGEGHNINHPFYETLADIGESSEDRDGRLRLFYTIIGALPWPCPEE